MNLSKLCKIKDDSMEELKKQLPEEMKRIDKITGTLEGQSKVKEAFEKQFKRKYQHGDNIVYDVARVNILRKLRGESPLI